MLLSDYFTDKKEKKDVSTGLIVGIVIVVLLLVVLLIVGIWYFRSHSHYLRGTNISFYKDMTTKPLEEDFDDDETTKVFDDGGPRCKVEFA